VLCSFIFCFVFLWALLPELKWMMMMMIKQFFCKKFPPFGGERNTYLHNRILILLKLCHRELHTYHHRRNRHVAVDIYHGVWAVGEYRVNAVFIVTVWHVIRTASWQIRWSLSLHTVICRKLHTKLRSADNEIWKFLKTEFFPKDFCRKTCMYLSFSVICCVLSTT